MTVSNEFESEIVAISGGFGFFVYNSVLLLKKHEYM